MAAMSLGLIGSRLGKYEILSEIGQGGMSVVYRARDTQLERPVAVKVMHAFLAEQPEARERFHREAVAVARLKHPHIIEIFDYSGENAALSYIVTELVEGSSLADLLKRTPLFPPEAALLIAAPVADALEHAHGHGVIHRDLKPENILVAKDGSLKLTDFGIARMLDNQTLTVTGTLLGSPAYMAPEYIDGDLTDARSDIFSFGAMLYQFAVGKLPFEAHSPHGLLKKIVGGEYVPPEQQNPSVHASLARLIKRCLQRDPNERYATAKDLHAALLGQLARLELELDTERPRLLADVEAYGRTLESDLLPRYLKLGKAALEQKRIGQATEDFDRVLSLSPEHAEVKKILRRLNRRAWTGRVVRDGALALLGAAAVTLGLGTWLGTPTPIEPKQEPVVVAPPPSVEAERNVVFVILGKGDLYVDDRLVTTGAEDSFAALLPPGKHLARLVGQKRTDDAAFEVPKTGKVDAVLLDVRVDTLLASRPPPPAVVKEKDVQLRMTGSWANVYVDGELARSNVTSPFILNLRYGEHTVRLATDFSDSAPITLRVSDSEPGALEPIVMRPLPARLHIDGAPAGSIVEVPGLGLRRAVLEGEPVRVPLAAIKDTEYEVVVVKDAQVLLRARPTFKPGKDMRLAVTTKPL